MNPEASVGAHSVEPAPKAENLVEVWGDTVDRRHVLLAVALGCVLATTAYTIGLQIFPHFVSNSSLSRTYAMLLGLCGALVAATISARLFPPQA